MSNPMNNTVSCQTTSHGPDASSEFEAALLSYNTLESSSSNGGDSSSNRILLPLSSLPTTSFIYPLNLSHLFISFLALVQSIEVDFLPITWHSALSEARRGGTAQLHQMAIDLESAFAFKRPSPLHGDRGPRQMQALITEVAVLGHPAVRRCENVIALEGIAWDVEHKTGHTWPVLVFQKATYGDLMAFVEKGEGKDLGFRERLELFADVLSAVTVLHENNVIHGDIKPQNVLMFHEKESKRKHVARLADFGYSAILTEKDVTFPAHGTKLWAAPEYIGGSRVTFETARRMDIFSLGKMCLWLLFQNRWEMENETVTTHLPAHTQTHRNLVDTALGHIHASKELDQETRQNLISFFELSLRRDPDMRTVECRTLLGLIDPQRAHDMQLPVEFMGKEGRLTPPFKIYKSIAQFLLADYRVAQCIHKSLRDIVNSPSSIHEHTDGCDAYRIELAFCYKIGFGVNRDEDAVKNVLKEADMSEAEVDEAVAEIVQYSEGPQFRNLIYRDLVEVGRDYAANFDITYQMEGHLEDAINQHSKDVENLSAVFGPSHILTLVMSTTLCEAMRRAEKWDAAIALRIKITEMLTEVKGEHGRDTLSSKSKLAAMHLDFEDWDEAEKIFLEVREKQLKASSEEDHETIETAHGLAEVYRRKGKWKEAEALLLPAMEERQRSLGRTHPDTLRLVSKVAALRLSTQRYAEAQELLEELVESRKARLGDRHPETLACMANLATVYYHQEENWEAAEKLYKHVEAVRLKLYNEDHHETLIGQANLASLYKKLGKYNEAERIERHVLQVQTNKFGKENRSTLVTQGNLALTYAYQEKWTEAAELGRELVSVRRKVAGPDHPHTLIGIHNLAEALIKLKQVEEAKTLLLQGRKDALDAGRDREFEVELLLKLLYLVYLSETGVEDASHQIIHLYCEPTPDE